MNISINLGPWLPVPAIEGGSTHRAWHRLGKEFVGLGHKVSITSKTHPLQPSEETLDGIRFIRTKGFQQGKSQALNLSKDLLYAANTLPSLPKSDILVIHDFWLPILARIQKRKLGKIAVVVGRFPRGQHRFYSAVDLFIPNSQVIYDALANHLPDSDSRCVLISNPVDTSVFRPSNERDTFKHILYAGRLHPEKGLDLLIQAFQELSKQDADLRLSIIGPYRSTQGGGGEDYFEDIKKQAAGLPISFLEPEFQIDKLAQIYTSCDMFVYPTLAEQGESFPMAPLEAMASKKAVILSNLSCFQNTFIDKENCRKFDHNAPEPHKELAKVIQDLLGDRKQAQQIASAGLEIAKQHSFPHIAKQYIRQFEALLTKG